MGIMDLIYTFGLHENYLYKYFAQYTQIKLLTLPNEKVKSVRYFFLALLL